MNERQNAEYPIADGGCVVVMVHRAGEGAQAFNVSGYAQPAYTASSIREMP